MVEFLFRLARELIPQVIFQVFKKNVQKIYFQNNYRMNAFTFPEANINAHHYSGDLGYHILLTGYHFLMIPQETRTQFLRLSAYQ